jgi:hypothetical protein
VIEFFTDIYTEYRFTNGQKIVRMHFRYGILMAPEEGTASPQPRRAANPPSSCAQVSWRNVTVAGRL